MAIQEFFSPLKVISKRTFFILAFVEGVMALLIWQLTAGELIPTPARVATAIIGILGTDYFYSNLVQSLALIAEGMGISIAIALLVAYLSLIPVFKPIAEFVIKCRYLTLTGLIFFFTLITSNGHNLKLSLLVFGIVPFFVTSLLSVIDSINVQEYEMCRTLRMNSWRALLEVVIIGRFDLVLEVIRQNFAIAWIMITAVEGISMSEGGLGTMLIKSNKFINIDNAFAILTIVFLFGIFFDYLLGVIRGWLFPYTKLQLLS
ncbi:MAG: transporter permease subunit [Chlorobi bacterium]|nr:transporter permease subunit [Chlorobiota bacterium]